MTHTSQRTQIYLPNDLRQEIDSMRALSGESMAQYLRESAKQRVKKDKKRKVNLEKQMGKIFGTIDPKKSGWYGIDVIAWQRGIRRDRDI